MNGFLTYAVFLEEYVHLMLSYCEHNHHECNAHQNLSQPNINGHFLELVQITIGKRRHTPHEYLSLLCYQQEEGFASTKWYDLTSTVFNPKIHAKAKKFS